MDDPDCDPHLLHNTYAQFETVNRLVSGWGRVLRGRIAPLLSPGDTIVDVGCGGGDLVRRIAGWGRREGRRLRVVGVDPDRRAIDFANSRTDSPDVEFRLCRAEDLLERSERFDFVVSNHLLHHLTPQALPAFLETTGRLSRKLVVHNDLRRHALAYLAFSLGRPVFRDSFIVEDGLRSIRRAYSPGELRSLLPPGWKLERHAPYRNLVILEQ